MGDKESLEAIVNLMPPKARETYQSYQSLSLESAFPGRKMIVYTLEGGEPQDVEVLTFGSMHMAEASGPVANYKVTEQSHLQIGVIPKQHLDRDLFLSVPQNFIFKWKGKQSQSGVQFAPHYAILMKTRSKEFHQVEGDTYCTTLNNFRDRFPKVRIRY